MPIKKTLQRNAVIRLMGYKLPVIGFNSGRYDLQLIGKYFITHLGQEDEVLSGEKQGQIMYMNTPQFKFLDIRNYLSPGITYEKWVKTYGAKQTKSWLPYEWFDSADKLDYKGLPPILVLVFTTKKCVCFKTSRVRKTQACLSREGDADLRRLVGVLQQS